MTVAELIAFLQTQPQDLPVVHGMYSEFLLLKQESISVDELAMPRGDGWVAYKRGDASSQKYLVLPGN